MYSIFKTARSGNVKFFSAGDYLFDTYDTYANAAKGYAERFLSIGEGDYKPAYACVESKTKLEIKAAPYANITFKNERGRQGRFLENHGGTYTTVSYRLYRDLLHGCILCIPEQRNPEPLSFVCADFFIVL